MNTLTFGDFMDAEAFAYMLTRITMQVWWVCVCVCMDIFNYSCGDQKTAQE